MLTRLKDNFILGSCRRSKIILWIISSINSSCLYWFSQDEFEFRMVVLIVVPSIALLDQWYESLSQYFSDKEISLNGGGEQALKIRKICITTIDSLKNIIEENSEQSIH